MFNNILSAIDLWGSQYHFQINKNTRITSWKGGCLSLIFIIITLVYLIVRINDLVMRVDSKKEFKYEITAKPYLDFSKNPDFMIAYCLGGATNITYRDPVIIDALNITMNWKNTLNHPYMITGRVNIPVNKCRLKDFPKSVTDHFTYKNYYMCSCVNSKSLSKYNISYFNTDSYFTTLDLEVKFNDTILRNPTLYNYYTNYFNMQTPRSFMYFVDTIADVDDYVSPFKNFLNFHSQFLNPGTMVVSNLYMNKIFLELDDNLVLNSVSQYSGISLEKENSFQKDSINFNNTNQFNILHSNRFRASNKNIVIKRKGVKLDEFISAITSFLINFYIILAFFNEIINNFESKQLLVHTLFKNYKFNNQVIKKIKSVREGFMEVQEKNEDDDNKDVKIDKSKDTKMAIANENTALNFNKEKSSRPKRKKSKEIHSNKNTGEDMKIEVRKVDNLNSNDPLDKNSGSRADKIRYIEEIYKNIEEVGFKYDWLKNNLSYFCKTGDKRNKYLIRKKYFDNALSFVDYYLDISVFFRKMMEIDLMKAMVLNKQQYILFETSTIPNFSFKAQEKREETLKEIYGRNKLLDENLKNVIETEVTNSKQNKKSDKIIGFLQNNNIIFELNDY